MCHNVAWTFTLVVFVVILSTVIARSTSATVQHLNNHIAGEKVSSQIGSSDSSEKQSEEATLWNDFSLIYRIYEQCAAESSLSVCLKVKLLTGLEKAFRSSKDLKLIEGIQFVSTDDAKTTPNSRIKIITEKDIEAVLPRSLEAKEQILNSMIFNKMANYLQGHTLQVYL